MAFIVEVTRYVRHSERPASVEQRNQELAEAETEELTDQAEGFADAIDYTDEDEGALTMPWTATMTFGRGRGDWVESVCAENTKWYSGKEAAVPQAGKLDF